MIAVTPVATRRRRCTADSSATSGLTISNAQRKPFLPRLARPSTRASIVINRDRKRRTAGASLDSTGCFFLLCVDPAGNLQTPATATLVPCVPHGPTSERAWIRPLLLHSCPQFDIKPLPTKKLRDPADVFHMPGRMNARNMTPRHS
jgi:hypothetical protein